VTLWIFDTDCLSLFQADNSQILDRVRRTPPTQLATTIITVEEQMRGRLNLVRRAENTRKLGVCYGYLQNTFEFLCSIQVMPFAAEAEDIYWSLKAQKIRPGSRDLKIAAIALSLNATVVTRNRKDFQQVPDLKFEDWSA
jgi:tRNA(fMet)-specific endonuclease VapC